MKSVLSALTRETTRSRPHVRSPRAFQKSLSLLCLSAFSMQVWAQAPANAPAPSATTAPTASAPASFEELRRQIANQENEIKKLQESLESQRALLNQALQQASVGSAAPSSASTPGTATAAIPSPKRDADNASDPANLVPVVNVARANGRWSRSGQTAAASSPLSISIGNTTFTPLGFIDATTFWRSTNVGSGIGTNFAGLPLSNAAGAHLSETNFSAQNSRIGMRVDSTFMGWKVLGYLEADFLFNNNANSYQIGSNSAGLRLRNYFVDANDGMFEVLGGQDWSFLTPNRKGLSPVPSDIFYTQNMDTNYQIGLVWTRAPQFRFIAHPNEHVAFGVALENPQQYIGGGNGSGAVTLPAGLSGIQGQFQYSPGLNVANSITNVPNLMPDIQGKVALDGGREGHTAHLEVAGFMSGFKDYVLPSVAKSSGATAGSHTAFGGGAEVNSNFELFKGFRLIENAFWSEGGGRYLFGSAPDFIVRPDGSLSLIKSASTVDGFEAQVSKNTQLALYYGGMYIGRNLATDPKAVATAAATGTTLASPFYIGYGYPGVTGYAGGSATQNRYIQEITFDWTQTLWKNKNYGSLSLINQYSYVFREPWAESPTTPKQAHTNMIYIDLRYTLP